MKQQQPRSSCKSHKHDNGCTSGMMGGGKDTSTPRKSKTSDKYWEKWERFRESKLEKMRMHKHNVERRMRCENMDDKGYWLNRRDKLKRFSRQEALDPSWYTDNIYSNQSIDLDEDYVPECVRYEQMGLRDVNGNDDSFEPDDIFSFHPKPKAGNMQRGEFKYPKSRSCCFGGSYDLKPKPPVPKSHSFSTTRGASNLARIREIKHSYEMSRAAEMAKYHQHRPPYGASEATWSRCKRYCVDESHYRDDFVTSDQRDLDKHHFKPNRIPPPSRVTCTHPHCRDMIEEVPPPLPPCCAADPRLLPQHSEMEAEEDEDEWVDCTTKCTNTYGGDKKGNFQDFYRPSAATAASMFESDDSEGMRRHRKQTPANCLRREYEAFIKSIDDNSSVYDEPQQQLQPHPPPPPPHLYHHHHVASCNDRFNRRSSFDTELDQFIREERSKLMLQDKYCSDDIDDYLCSDLSYTHPTSMIRNKTMLEVKPPNKYDDTSSDSTDLDLDDFNFDFEKYWEELDKAPSPLDLDMQNKNTYNNLNQSAKIKNVNIGRYNNGMFIDEFNERANHPRYYVHNVKNNVCCDDLPSPQHHINNIGYIDNNLIHNACGVGGPIPSGSPILNRFSRKIHPQPEICKYNNFYQQEGAPIDPAHRHPHHHNNHAISLINNIFSIYKPNKYSPLNCHTHHIGLKPEPCKKMNVPSTVRPLGAPENNFMHSLKRPLLVTPPPDQPRFKIIPGKTGLKISPLYRFDFGGDKGKIKLKSTARPLLFPH